MCLLFKFEFYVSSLVCDVVEEVKKNQYNIVKVVLIFQHFSRLISVVTRDTKNGG